jgi:hypothetical protein
MRVSVALASVNDNPAYWEFVPAQVRFWGRWGIRFVAVLAAPAVPPQLQAFADAGHVVLWDRDLDLAGQYLGQHLRIWYPALMHLPDDEMVLITDMDMLPLDREYFCGGLEALEKRDFVHYWSVMHHVADIVMCYNAAHPDTWARVTGVRGQADVSARLREHYPPEGAGPPGSGAWWLDQKLMYRLGTAYEHLRELHRPPRRLDVDEAKALVARGEAEYLHRFSDGHFHRSFARNEALIRDVERQHRGAAEAALRAAERSRAIVSFCIYGGNNPKYTEGLWRNVQRLADASSSGALRLECVLVVAGDDAPEDLLRRIETTWPELCTVVRVPYRGQRLMFERFLQAERFAASRAGPDRDVCVFVRDADSRVGARDLWCMRQFMHHRPAAILHTVRDHLWHRRAIMGCSAGWRAGTLPLSDLFDGWRARQGKSDDELFQYGADERFLEEAVYPAAMARPGGFVAHTGGICRHRGERRGEHILPIGVAREDDHDFVGNVMLVDQEGWKDAEPGGRRRPPDCPSPKGDGQSPDRPMFTFLGALQVHALDHIAWLDRQGAHEEIADVVRMLNPPHFAPGTPDATRQALLVRLYLAQYYANAPAATVQATFRMFAHAPVTDFIIAQSNYWVAREQAHAYAKLRVVGVTGPAEVQRLLDGRRASRAMASAGWKDAEEHQRSWCVGGHVNRPEAHGPACASERVLHVIYGSAPQDERSLPGGPIMVRHPLTVHALRHDAFLFLPGWERVARIAIITRPKATDRYAALLCELCRIGAPVHRVWRYEASNQEGEAPYAGATRNHCEVLEAWVAETPASRAEDAILVLEDDVAFTPCARQVADALRAVLEGDGGRGPPDYDVALLATSKHGTLRDHPTEPGLRLSEQPCTTSSAYLVTRRRAPVIAAVIREGYDQLVRTNDAGRYCVDRYWTLLQRGPGGRNGFVVFRPKLAYQRPTLSNLTGAVNMAFD